MPSEILCIGHASFDLGVQMDSFPAENSKCETDTLMESGGGPAANAAFLLASWGAKCAFAGLVGDDGYGRRVADELRGAGLELSLLETRPGHGTPLSIILINRQTGSRTIVNRKLRDCALHLDAAALARMSPRVLLFDGHELPASLEALSAFPDAVSILDAGSWREGTAELAGHVDYLVASERFARQAAGVANLRNEDAQRACISHLRAQYSTAVIVTMGEHGLIADDGNGFFHLPAFPAIAVDTTGAGDIFHGAFAYAVAQKMPLLEGLHFASMAGSLSVRVAGGRASIPTLEAVKKELAHAR